MGFALLLGPPAVGRGIPPAGFAGESQGKGAQKRVPGRQYKLEWTYTPQKALAQPDGYVRVPLPTQNLPYQSARYEVAGVRSHKMGSENGNEFLLVAPDGENPFTVTAFVTVRPYSYRAELARVTEAAPVPSDVLPYLGETDRIDPQSPKIQAIAAPLEGGDPVTTIKNVLGYLNRTVRYDRRKAAFIHAEEVAERGAGDCGCYAALFVALCRANQIPAREVWGLSRSYDRRSRHPRASGSEWFADHAWAEVYLPPVGWMAVEPQHADLSLPGTGCVRLAHFDPQRGNHLKENASAMGAHPPASEELTQSAGETAE
jgi:hypothetical protein